jgi:hypothetical protein
MSNSLYKEDEMENRKIVSTPVSGETPVKARPEDFEPQVTSGGPPVEDRPTPPPVDSYGIDAGQPCPPVKK